MARVKLSRGLREKVAGTVVRRAVDDVADRAEREVRRHVPDAKQWQTSGDENVRPSHAETDGQNIPANVPYRVPKAVYVRKGSGGENAAGGWKTVPGWDLADKPRDPGLPLHQRVNCQCESQGLPGAIAKTVTRTPVQVGRSRVSAKITVTYPRIAESEFSERGGGWLATAARAAART
ncbi:hypothetical protein ACGFJC_47360 [Nonomuraea fuscirosea]|uniref:hypothetical protein n=1 Tax=Nonomuraea fuscirosea TaxID=1291556 RepID=UPI00371B27D3